MHGLKSQEKLIKNQDALLNSYEELRGKRRLQAELGGYAFSDDAIQPQHANANLTEIGGDTSIVASGNAGLDEGAVENSHDAS